jgi:hypothetical protein
MKIVKSISLLFVLLFCSCAKILTDAEKTAKNSSASSRINNSQSSSNNTLKDLD